MAGATRARLFTGTNAQRPSRIRSSGAAAGDPDTAQTYLPAFCALESLVAEKRRRDVDTRLFATPGHAAGTARRTQPAIELSLRIR